MYVSAVALGRVTRFPPFPSALAVFCTFMIITSSSDAFLLFLFESLMSFLLVLVAGFVCLLFVLLLCCLCRPCGCIFGSFAVLVCLLV